MSKTRFCTVYRYALMTVALVAGITSSKSALSANIPTDAQVDSALYVCGMGRSRDVTAAVKGQIDLWRQRLQAGANASNTDLAGILSRVPEGQQINPDVYKDYVRCIDNRLRPEPPRSEVQPRIEDVILMYSADTVREILPPDPGSAQPDDASAFLSIPTNDVPAGTDVYRLKAIVALGYGQKLKDCSWSGETVSEGSNVFLNVRVSELAHGNVYGGGLVIRSDLIGPNAAHDLTGGEHNQATDDLTAFIEPGYDRSVLVRLHCQGYVSNGFVFRAPVRRH